MRGDIAAPSDNWRNGSLPNWPWNRLSPPVAAHPEGDHMQSELDDRARMTARHAMVMGLIDNNARQLRCDNQRHGVEIERLLAVRAAALPGAPSSSLAVRIATGVGGHRRRGSPPSAMVDHDARRSMRGPGRTRGEFQWLRPTLFKLQLRLMRSMQRMNSSGASAWLART
jgi:hypothetical protein